MFHRIRNSKVKYLYEYLHGHLLLCYVENIWTIITFNNQEFIQLICIYNVNIFLNISFRGMRSFLQEYPQQAFLHQNLDATLIFHNNLSDFLLFQDLLHLQ